MSKYTNELFLQNTEKMRFKVFFFLYVSIKKNIPGPICTDSDNLKQNLVKFYNNPI